MGLFSWLFGRRGSRDAVHMRISPAYLPSELHYVVSLAELHGYDARVAEFDHRLGRHVKYAERLSAEAIDSLRKLYIEIRDKGHGPLINRWHHAHSGKGTCPAETTWPVYGLLCLFNQLGELGIAPFNDGAVWPVEFREELDWSKLPVSLRYLAGPAEVYGAYQFEGKILDFLHSQMTAEERAELQALRQRYGEDEEAISRWFDKYPITEHPEARLVYFTGHLLALGGDAGLL